MSAVLTRPDPGPMARFREVAEDAQTMGIIVQRLTDVDRPETLKDIARAWKVPYGKLAEWITEDRDRAEQYSNALRFAADSFAHDCVPLADSAKPEDVAVRKLQIETRLKLARVWDRAKYGDATEVKHTGSLSLIAVLGGLPRGREAIDVTPVTVTSAALPPQSVEVPSKNSAPPGEDLVI